MTMAKGDPHDVLSAPGLTFTKATPIYDVVAQGGASKVRFTMDKAAVEQLRRLLSAPPGLVHIEKAKEVCSKAMFEIGEREKRASKSSDPFTETEVDTSLNDSTDPGYLRRWAAFLREASAQGWNGGRGIGGAAPPLSEEYKVEYFVVSEEECANAKLQPGGARRAFEELERSTSVEESPLCQNLSCPFSLNLSAIAEVIEKDLAERVEKIKEKKRDKHAAKKSKERKKEKAISLPGPSRRLLPGPSRSSSGGSGSSKKRRHEGRDREGNDSLATAINTSNGGSGGAEATADRGGEVHLSGSNGERTRAAADGAADGKGGHAHDGERHSHKRHRSSKENGESDKRRTSGVTDLKDLKDIKNAGDLKPEELSAGWRMKRSERKEGRAYFYKIGREKEITWKRSDVVADVKASMHKSKAVRHERHKDKGDAHRRSTSSSKRMGSDDDLAPPAIPLPPKPPGM